MIRNPNARNEVFDMQEKFANQESAVINEIINKNENLIINKFKEI